MYIYTEAKKKVCIYVHLTKYGRFYEENVSLSGIKLSIDLTSS